VREAQAARRRLIALSLALGIAVLAAVPLHAALRADAAVLEHRDYLEPACETPLAVFPEPVCPKVVAGESPAMVAFALVAAFLVARGGGRRALQFVTVASLALALVQLVTPFAVTFPAVDGSRPGPFEAETGCGLVNCGLDHTIFHLAQVPFLLGMAALSRRVARVRHTGGDA
jgi:hypothetical protein